MTRPRLVPCSLQRRPIAPPGRRSISAPASPNQRPRCSASVIRFQTRSTGALMTVSRSIWSGTMGCNLRGLLCHRRVTHPRTRCNPRVTRHTSTAMPHTLLTFLPVATLLTVTPGVATVLVVQRAARDGRRAALLTTAGNELGVLVWAVAAAIGLAAVVAASAAVFTAVKLAGALVLLIMGLRALLHRGSRARLSGSRFGRERSAFASGLVT